MLVRNASQFTSLGTKVDFERCYYPRKLLSRQEHGNGCGQSRYHCLPVHSLTMVQNPPLYLHVTSTSKTGLEQAVAKIEELMKQELPALVDERRFRRRDQEQVERDEYGRVRMT